MKTKILSTIALLFGLLMTAKAQNSNWNYVHTRTMLTATADSCMDNVVYYDGLGRPFQNAQLHAAPNGQSIVDFTEYDASGRVWKQWNKAYTSGEFMPHEGVSLSYPYIYNDDHCYTETVYDGSPLNRATEQYGPGNVWAEHPVNTDYLVNDSTTAELKCLYYSVNTNGTLNANNGASYPTGSLHVVKTTDEDGNVGYVFTDKQERILLERRMNGTVAHDTYYVYDVYGNLCFVLQPMYQDNNSVDLFAFQYKYDHRNRCIWKKLPGAAYVEYVYNNADQLTHSQDGVQRASGKWLYYKYDGFNRMTEWGVTSSKTATTGTAYVKNYYDGYSFIGTTGFTNGNFTSGDTNGRGKLTGSVVTVPELTSKLYKAFYYDEKGRMVKSVESNLMAGYNVVNTTYSFTDKPLTVTRTHNGGMGFSMSETYTYSYDHADRLIKTEHTLNGSTITMAEYTYDNLGRMFSKRLHGKEAFRTDYTYNIRNWLTAMAGDLFTQNLHYTDGLGTAYYNGNISSMTWQAGNETILRGYKYTYDGLNRMKNGTYGEGDTLGTNAGRYSEIAHNYDKNGNLGAGFLRNGRISDGSYSTISALVPTYNGNQLQSMYDACPYTPYEGTFGYDAGYGDGIEYFYDGNGNLTQDLNKGISNISYNMLSLPSVVTFSDGSTITYYYDAEGNKVRVIYNITGETSLQRNYSNGVIYDNGRQQCLITEEGYIALQENNKYYYYLKDHQGNNRVVVDEDENIVEVNHYYPFGGVFEPTGDVQRYKYNGKEYIADGGLNWYDYGARHYDPAISRFTTMDPLVEKYYSTSPYAYCLNNPVKYIDPTGMLASPIYDEYGNLLGTDDKGLQGSAIVMRKEYFKQGMSHADALKSNLGSDGLIDDNAKMNFQQSYNSLPSRPDYDGKLTLSEANSWYRNGNGQPLFVALNKINLDGILSLGESYVGDIKSVNLLVSSNSINDGLVYGQITLKRYPNHQVRAYSDKYNFEMHSWRNPMNWGRNIETLIGRKVAGNGMPYEINIYGSKTLKPILPWLK